ncbi:MULTISPECIES: S1 family peptidase [unclassified Streptomyces]|uniref:S1 family peptidase n=1 Tax=unclassified Streptomyces TaxID=2593676 RepID=UPI002DDA1929|nr:S1 family peptidase [Streptomyces sp. NBC_01750]WSB05249.1 S1 family peptidase [Streptomyces sp. NBC_01794]WSD38030.1 S1 family peptidase [Streptomyces sp. NBC_01750]
MAHARRRLQRIARLAAVGGLLGGTFMISNAVASEPPSRPEAAGGTSQGNELGAGLVSELGTSRTAGTWIGSDGRPVVAVTDTGAAAEVKRAGAHAEIVRHSMRQLRSATDTLSQARRVPGTAWRMDYKSNTVVVQADSTVSPADWQHLSKIAEEVGGMVKMQRTQGTFTTRVNGAEPILDQAGRCSAGFNVTNGSDTFVLTAGHCGPAGSTWFSGNRGTQQLGTMTASDFPGTDYALIRYQNNQAPVGPNIVNIGDGQGVQITSAADPFVGQQVFRSGSTTGLRTGKVTGLNATVNYPEGTVTGLIETTVCAEPGDSGGPLIAQGIALGITSGGDGDCRNGGTTYFQPATAAMAALGVRLTGTAPSDNNTAAGAQPNNPTPPPPDNTQTGAGAGGDTPLVPGQSNGSNGPTRVTSIIDTETLAPGIIVIAISLTGLIATRAIWTAQDRREFRMHYKQSWN